MQSVQSLKRLAAGLGGCTLKQQVKPQPPPSPAAPQAFSKRTNTQCCCSPSYHFNTKLSQILRSECYRSNLPQTPVAVFRSGCFQEARAFTTRRALTFGTKQIKHRTICRLRLRLLCLAPARAASRREAWMEAHVALRLAVEAAQNQTPTWEQGV